MTGVHGTILITVIVFKGYGDDVPKVVVFLLLFSAFSVCFLS